MPGIATDGDYCGGSIIATGYSVKINGKAVALLGDRITGHGDCPHCGPSIVAASGSVFVQGIPAARDGDAASCGHSIVASSFNANAG